jgi:hypothetical protein
MKRAIPLLLAVLLVVPNATAKKESSMRAELLNAKFVVVTNYPDSGENMNGRMSSYAGDRQALADVEAAIRKWGRWTVISSNSHADLIIAVRKGRIAGAGVRIPTGGVDIPPRQGADRYPTMESEVGPNEDMIAIYSAQVWLTGRPGEGNALDVPPLWRLIQANALISPSVPGVQQLRKEIEKAEAENAKAKK